MASEGRDVGSGRRPPPERAAQDDAVSALVRHPTWSITKTEEGLIYTRSVEGPADIALDREIEYDQVARLKKHIDRAFGGSAGQLLLRSRSSSGADQDLEVHLKPVVDDGEVQKVVGSTTAVAESPRMAAERTERLPLARTVVEAAPECIVVMDHEGWIVEFNPAAEEAFGYPRDEALKMKVADLMPPEMAAVHNQRLRNYLDTGEAFLLDVRWETMMRRANGTLFPIEAIVTRVAERSPPLFVGFLRDLTEFKRTEEALLDSELRLGVIAQNIPDLIFHFRLRPDQAFEYVSPACAKLLGYEAAEFYAEPDLWRRIVHSEDLPVLLRAFRGDPPNAMLHVRCIRKDGKTIHCQLSNSTVRDRWGEAAASVGVLRDETDRIHARQQLRESGEQLLRADAERLRLLRKLVAAHEDERRSIAAAIHDDSIQAVAALAIRVSALRRKVPDDAIRASLSDIEQSVSDAVSRLRRLMFELHPTTLDRGGLAATVEAHFAQLTDEGEPNYALENKLTREPSQGAALALYRVIQEAVTNARKHAHASNILVLLDESEGEYVARIHDDGRGFAVTEIESPAGHLGLSTMREQAEMAGGSISIESTEAGTTVEARVPAGY
jgi:PAS domain S-box-containing protein